MPSLLSAPSWTLLTGYLRQRLSFLLVAPLYCSFVVAPATAQDVCGQFACSSQGKRDPFEGYMPAFESGDAVPASPGAFALKLKPSAQVIYPFPVGRAGDVGYGGVVTIEIVRAGQNRIALSSEAWVDALQDNVFLPMWSQAYDPECPSVHRSVVLTTERGPLTLQIRGARAPTIMIGIGRRLECAPKNAPL